MRNRWSRPRRTFTTVFLSFGLWGALFVPTYVTAAQGSQGKKAESEHDSLAAILQANHDAVALVRELEDYLERFPHSLHRLRVYRLLFQRSSEIQEFDKALKYGDLLYRETPEDRTLLLELIGLTQRRGFEKYQRAIEYAQILVDQAEQMVGEKPASADSRLAPGSPQVKFAAAAYMIRGHAYQNAGRKRKAEQDFTRSFEWDISSLPAERLGDLALGRGDAKEAMEQYGRAFVIPTDTPDPARRRKLRRKLGVLYASSFGSEEGLGAWLLERYDEWAERLRDRYPSVDRPNAGVRDPYKFNLERLDGTIFRLEEEDEGFDGRVLVLEFWASWCGPCRTSGKLVEAVRKKFQLNKDVVFLGLSTDDDKAAAQAFLREERWAVPAAMASGLNDFFDIGAIPTFMVFNRHRRLTFRQEGFAPSKLISTLETKIKEALQSDVAPHLIGDPAPALIEKPAP